MRDDSSGTAGTVCPFCAVGCRLDREDGRVRGREGAANPNGRLCEKGLRAFDPVEADDRLTRPLVREAGDLVPASWERAIDVAVEGFRTVLDDHGPDALAFLGAPHCTNEENYLLQQLARTLGTNQVDNRARRCHAATAQALDERLGWPATTNALADLRRADLILAVGANPAVRQPIAFDAAVRPAVAEGATLIHVDPHRNETTRLATHHVAPRPGTDALVVSCVCAILVEAGDADAAFVRDRTTGVDRFRAWLADLDLPAGAERAGVDVATLETVAAELGEADRVAVLAGTGADRPATADAIVNLLLLTGNLGRPGTGLHVLRGLANEQGAVDAGCVPDRLPGHRPVSDPDARAAVAAEWGVEPPSTSGSAGAGLLSGEGDARGALVVGENPAVSKRDPDRTAERLAELDVLVVADCRHSETTRHADFVLPAATGVEKAGTVTNLDRQVQRLHPRATPPGEARPDFEILQALGRGLVGDGFGYADPAAAFEALTRVAPPYAGLDYETLGDRSGRWPTDNGDNSSSTGVLYGERFATADGRARLVPVALPGDRADPADGTLHLVVGDRAGRFAGEEAAEHGRLVVHPDDADARDLTDGATVVVSNDAATVEARARVSQSIRPGMVYLHASVADPLVRGGSSRVELDRRSPGSDGVE